MAKHARTKKIIEIAYSILENYHPMTLRQVYYQLVAKQIIDNNRGQYQAVSNALVDARKTGAIPWDWIEDRLRRPRQVSMWSNLADFADTAAKAYRRNVWDSQPGYLETWLEKDALSGIFEEVLEPYGVTLNVGRGYDGWSSIHNASQRLGSGENVSVLYFGDFDPSGEDMVRSLRERLSSLFCLPEIIKCALTAEDIALYNLPPDFTKASDTRQAAFVAKHGDIAVELDALPVTVLRTRLEKEVQKRMDLAALKTVQEIEQSERQKLITALQNL